MAPVPTIDDLMYGVAMRVVLQKVSSASVSVDGSVIGSIGEGYLLFLGVIDGDTEEQARWLAEKIVKLRLFDGEDAKINDKSILDVDGGILVISQFTLAGRTEKGNRPDYTQAMKPQEAEVLYNRFIDLLKENGVQAVASGSFGAHMEVELINDGPVTLVLEKAS
jgi:D-aminoacyl-tRNA deacylase